MDKVGIVQINIFIGVNVTYQKAIEIKKQAIDELQGKAFNTVGSTSNGIEDINTSIGFT